MQKKRGGERPFFSALGPTSSMTRLCMVLSAIEQEWASIVGSALARRSAPRSYEDGVLVVSVDSSAVMQDMNFRKSAILREIRAKTLLKMRDIRTEIGVVRRCDVRRRPAAGRRDEGRASRVDKAVEEALASEILAEHGHLDPAVAHSLARCRMMCDADD